MTILFDGRFKNTPNFGLYNRVDRTPSADLPPRLNGRSNEYEIVIDPLGSSAVAKLTVTCPQPIELDPPNIPLRCELRPNEKDAIGTGGVFGERWYAWEDLFLNDWVNEPPGVRDPASQFLSSTRDIIAQGHSFPDVGEQPHFPQLALYIQHNRIYFCRTYDPNPATEPAPNLSIHGSWPLTTMRWIEWVLNVNWAIDSRGFFHLYKDRRLVYSQTGVPTCYNGAPFFKLGFYKFPDPLLSPTRRVRYSKGIVIGDSSSSFSEVTGHTLLEPATIRCIT